LHGALPKWSLVRLLKGDETSRRELKWEGGLLLRKQLRSFRERDGDGLVMEGSMEIGVLPCAGKMLDVVAMHGLPLTQRNLTAGRVEATKAVLAIPHRLDPASAVEMIHHNA